MPITHCAPDPSSKIVKGESYRGVGCVLINGEPGPARNYLRGDSCSHQSVGKSLAICVQINSLYVGDNYSRFFGDSFSIFFSIQVYITYITKTDPKYYLLHLIFILNVAL